METIAYGQVLARFGHALSDPTRARLLLALREAPAHPADLADLLGVSRQIVSNHLACLRGGGLVVATYQGGQVHYGLADPHLARARRELGSARTVSASASGQPSSRPGLTAMTKRSI